MQTIRLRQLIARFSTIGGMSILALAPLLGSGPTAQADPPGHAPAWGYRGKDKKDKKDKKAKHHAEGRDDDWDDDEDDEEDREWRRGRRGRQGRRGRHAGERGGNNGGNNNVGTRIDFSGVVTAVRSEYRLTVRGDDGRTYDVNSRTRLSSSIDRGDHVYVVGSADGRFVRAARVNLVHDGGSGHGGSGSGSTTTRRVNFRATVLSVDDSPEGLHVRGDNGRTYFVRYGDADDFERGDRVRIVGSSIRGVVTASRVTRA